MRERERVQLPVPERGVDRVLLALGAAALLAVVPMLWIWLLYGSRLSGVDIVGAGVGLSALTAGIGAAMIRILDNVR
ncbi:MAG: hypothetical protein ACJ75Z_04090 [Solirubrobacterales bacterium]